MYMHFKDYTLKCHHKQHSFKPQILLRLMNLYYQAWRKKYLTLNGYKNIRRQLEQIVTIQTNIFSENICKQNYKILNLVLNATFNNISVISWRSVFLMEEIGVPWENHWPATSHWQTLSHNVVPLALSQIHNISTDYIGSCKSNHHPITATTAPHNIQYAFILSDN